MAKLFGKDLSAYDDINIDELLLTLSPEELEELGTELIDPDDSHIPPSDRCRYRIDKEPTGPFNRKKLLDFLAKKAREEKDWDEIKPYLKEIRGKVWKPKEEDKIQLNDDDDVDTEWDDILAKASEEELVDLAAILGFHGMLNQVQYHQAFVEQKSNEEAGGFQGVAKHQDFKLVDDEPPNDTDVEATLQKVKDNDAETKEVNLNNIKKISLQTLSQYADALKTNTHLEKLHMANVKATDRVAKKLGEALEENKTLLLLNVESNYISGDGIINILEGVNKHKVIEELRVSNQRPQVIGVRKEMKIAELIKQNDTIKKFGIFMEVPTARIKVQDAIERNNDEVRKERVGDKDKEDKEDVKKKK